MEDIFFRWKFKLEITNLARYFSDMWNSNNILNGYGFQEIIPAMNSDQRLGQDGTNINVHNYVIHIFSQRGDDTFN